MRLFLAILLSGALLAFAGMATAEEQPATPNSATTATAADSQTPQPAEAPVATGCTPSGFTQVASGYAYTEDAEVLSTQPVSQTDLALTCNKWTFDAFVSAGLSSKGSFGHRGYADEVDLTVDYNDQARTPIGPVDVEFQAAYWVIADFSNPRDDIVALHADFGRAFTLGHATVTPYVRATAWLGLGDFGNTFLGSAGVRVSTPIHGRFGFEGNFGYSEDFTDRYGTAYAVFGPTYDLGHGFTLSANVQVIHAFTSVEEPPVMGILKLTYSR